MIPAQMAQRLAKACGEHIMYIILILIRNIYSSILIQNAFWYKRLIWLTQFSVFSLYFVRAVRNTRE